MAVDNRTEEVVMFDEIYESRTNIEQLSDIIETTLKKWGIPKYRVKRIYTDPAGNAEELTSGISPVDYLRMERGWKVENKGSLIVYGLHLVRSYMKAADGKRKFFILNTCINALKSISGYSYAVQRITDLVKEEPLKDGIHDHMCDAIRYFFVNRFDKAKWVAKEADIQSYLGEAVKKPTFKRCAVCHLPFPSKTSLRQPPHICNKCKELNDASQLAN